MADNGAPTGKNPFRTLPYNVDAERGLLGALLVDNRCYERVSEFLRPEHFAFEPHSVIYDACVVLIERNAVADPITLITYFENNQSLDEVGGPSYMAELASAAVTIITRANTAVSSTMIIWPGRSYLSVRIL